MQVPPAMNWVEVLANDAVEPTYLVEPLILEDRTTSIVGGAKRGKSKLVFWLALRMLLKGLRVLILDLEMSRQDWALRLHEFGVTDPQILSNLIVISTGLVPLDTRSGEAFVKSLVDAYGPDVFVVDPLISALSGNENDAQTFGNLARYLVQPLKERGITRVVLDHTGNRDEGRARGSSAKLGLWDVSWHLDRPPTSTRLTLTSVSRVSDVPAEVIMDLETTSEGDVYRLVSSTDRAGKAMAKRLSDEELGELLESDAISSNVSADDLYRQLTDAGVNVARAQVRTIQGGRK